MFEAPEGSTSFIEDVKAKCEKYIQHGYWEGIELINLRGWLNNFKTENEQYFAACILDAFVFRSQRMISSSIKDIACSKIPSFLKKKQIAVDDDLEQWFNRLSLGQDVPFRVLPVETVDGREGKSGDVVIRRVSECLNLAHHITRSLGDFENLNNQVKAIVLVDDIVGTGDQFRLFFEELKKQPNFKNYEYLYVPLAAHEEGIKQIHQHYPEIEVSPVELLTWEDSFFHPIEGYFRGDKKNTVKDAKEFYLSLCQEKGFEELKDMFGKGDLSLTFAFDFSTPNNNLKVLYHRHPNVNWTNLLTRRQ